MNKFDFREALQWLEFDETVGIVIDGKTRTYRKINNDIYCNVGDTQYKVKQFYIDAILSNDWFLVE